MALDARETKNAPGQRGSRGRIPFNSTGKKCVQNHTTPPARRKGLDAPALLQYILWLLVL
jgi:hypothetical protein